MAFDWSLAAAWARYADTIAFVIGVERPPASRLLGVAAVIARQ